MDLSSGNLTGEVDEAILILHYAALHNICHVLCDVLTPMVMLPTDLTNTTYIIGNFSYGNIKEAFTTIGFRESQLLTFSGDSDWFYAKKLHVLTKYRPINAYSGPPCVTLRKKFEEALSLNKIKPFRYAFINRTSKDRMITNFPEIKQEAEKMFPHINWEIMQDSVCSIKEMARNFRSLKLAFVVVGSTASKCFFMEAYTVACHVFTQFFDMTNLLVVIGSEHAVNGFFGGILHRDVHKDINVTESIKALNVSLYYLEHKKWPSC